MLLSKLKNNPSNPRTLSEVDFKKLLNKILVYPRLLEKNKITFDSEQDNVILGGNMRFKTLSHIIKEFANKDISKAIKQAQKTLGVDNKDLLNESVDIFSDIIDSKAIPDEWTQDAKGLTAEEKEAFIIIDNVSDGKWDFDVLANEWELDVYDWGLVDWKVEDDKEVDYSNKNQEYSDDDFEDKAILKLEFTLDDYELVKTELLKHGQTPESALFSLLKLDNNES
jgi:hypothetical protein